MFFIIAFSLSVLFTYPYSPLLFKFLPFNPYFGFAFNSFLISFLALKKSDFIIFKKFNNIHLILSIYILIISFCFIQTRNLTAIRDLLLLAPLLFISLTLKQSQILEIIKKYALILSLILITTLFVHLLLSLGIFSRLNWLVLNLNLSDDNPVMIRALSDDFQWSYILGILVHHHNFLTNYQRLTLIFLEPTQLSYFVMPLIAIFICDKQKSDRLIYIILLSLSFVLAFASSAFLSLLLSLLILVFFNSYGIEKTNSRFKKFYSFIFLISLFFIVFYVPLNFPSTTSNFLGYFGDRLSEGYNFIYEVRGFLGDEISPGWFGRSDLDEMIEKTYGLIIVFYRYGYLGIALIFFSVGCISYCLVDILTDRNLSIIERRVLFLSILSSTILSFKLTSIIFSQPFLLIVFSYCLRYKIKKQNINLII